MENASKALLIAGAILVAIIIIALGMLALNASRGVINTATSSMSDQEKTMHNEKFTIYEGSQSGSTVRALVQVVNTNNSNDDNVEVNIYSGTTGTTQLDVSTLKNAKTYVVDCQEDTNGVVNVIYVNERT